MRERGPAGGQAWTFTFVFFPSSHVFPLPLFLFQQWVRFRTGNTVRYNSKRRNWRRTKLGL